MNHQLTTENILTNTNQSVGNQTKSDSSKFKRNRVLFKDSKTINAVFQAPPAPAQISVKDKVDH